jgi:uncharacterized protein YicC (UPF0701 family)
VKIQPQWVVTAGKQTDVKEQLRGNFQRGQVNTELGRRRKKTQRMVTETRKDESSFLSELQFIASKNLNCLLRLPEKT